MRIRILTIVLTCCALGAGVLSAQNRGAAPDRKGASAPASHDARNDSRPPFKWWTVDKIKQELKLTSDQSARIEKAFQTSMDQLRTDKDDLDRAQATFSELMERPAVSELELSRAVSRLELARYTVSKERTTMLVRIHIILTPDQRKGLEAIRKRNDPRNDADRNRPH
jgi:Spy/CpxP family protein refolding chaperone